MRTLIIAALLTCATAPGCAGTPADRERPHASAGRPRPPPGGAYLMARVRQEWRCRREVPFGSRIPQMVCTTRAEDLLREEANRELLRHSTVPSH